MTRERERESGSVSAAARKEPQTRTVGSPQVTYVRYAQGCLEIQRDETYLFSINEYGIAELLLEATDGDVEAAIRTIFSEAKKRRKHKKEVESRVVTA